ncbi:hypothetical protein PI125_g11494 [Phytophthora idaei]|nr:hypothetical protein PI125_g11494 [Phytophthora idaei]
MSDDQHPKRRPWLSWRFVVTATIGVLVVVTQFTTYTHHFHAHLAKHRILRSLHTQPSLRLTF